MVKILLPNFQQKMGVISDYLDLCLDVLRGANRPLFDQITELPANYYNDAKAFDTLTVGGVNESAYLLENVPIRKRKARREDEIPASDFLIQSTKFCGKKPPLVLQTMHDGRDRNGNELNYYDGQPFVKLKPRIPTFYDPSVPLEKREVPGDIPDGQGRRMRSTHVWWKAGAPRDQAFRTYALAMSPDAPLSA